MIIALAAAPATRESGRRDRPRCASDRDGRRPGGERRGLDGGLLQPGAARELRRDPHRSRLPDGGAARRCERLELPRRSLGGSDHRHRGARQDPRETDRDRRHDVPAGSTDHAHAHVAGGTTALPGVRQSPAALVDGGDGGVRDRAGSPDRCGCRVHGEHERGPSSCRGSSGFRIRRYRISISRSTST